MAEVARAPHLSVLDHYTDEAVQDIVQWAQDARFIVAKSPDEDTERVTMAEARSRIAAEHCREFDHELHTVRAGNGNTHAIFCNRCGETWVKKQ